MGESMMSCFFLTYIYIAEIAEFVELNKTHIHTVSKTSNYTP